MGVGSYMVAKLHRYTGGPGKWKGDHGLLTTGPLTWDGELTEGNDRDGN
jgi:hypothetical protein